MTERNLYNILDMTVREVFAACGIGPEDIPDAIDAIDSQLSIFKNRIAPTRYVDSSDRVIFVAAIRKTGFWAAFAQDDQEDLSMVKLPRAESFTLAQQTLDAYAAKKGWMAIPDLGTVRSALSLVMTDYPGLAIISEWTEAQRVAVTKWAYATHLKASDNVLRVPPVPNVLFDYVRTREGAAA